MRQLFWMVGRWVVFSVTACDHKVYDHYCHTPVAGWEKNDTLCYDIAPMQQQGMYQLGVGLRLSNAYPFMGITLIVEQTVWPQRRTLIDTVECRLVGQHGKHKQHGISYFQYTQPIGKLSLQAGDSLHITVRHDMQRDILPGVSDVGIFMTKQ